MASVWPSPSTSKRVSVSAMLGDLRRVTSCAGADGATVNAFAIAQQIAQQQHAIAGRIVLRGWRTIVDVQ